MSETIGKGDSPRIWIREVGSRIQIRVPYSSSFVAGAHRLSGRWRKRSHLWSFHKDRREKLYELIQSIYGISCP